MTDDAINFDALNETLTAAGPIAAADVLIALLRDNGDYHALFYALLLKARVSLGVTPFPTGPAADLPKDAHEPYEEAIRQAAREIGRLYLAKADIPRAWSFFRLINEPAPVRQALDDYTPGEDDDIYPVLDVAWHQKVHPTRGFDLHLDRHGICSAITMLGQADLRQDEPLRHYCVGRLVDALHEQLRERLAADWQNRGWSLPDGATLHTLMKDELFTDEVYHVDTSHLASVVQMALELSTGPHLTKARELCDYGRRLAPAFRPGGDCPFERDYEDYGTLLAIMDTVRVAEGLHAFESKIEPELAEGNTFPAEVYINLLLKLNRKTEALQAAKRYLSDVPADAPLSCPTLLDLARQAGEFRTFAEAAKAQGDAVQYLAGLIAAKPSG